MYADISYGLADTNWKDLLSGKQRIFIRANEKSLTYLRHISKRILRLGSPTVWNPHLQNNNQHKSLKLGNASKTLSPFAFTG